MNVEKDSHILNEVFTNEIIYLGFALKLSVGRKYVSVGNKKDWPSPIAVAGARL